MNSFKIVFESIRLCRQRMHERESVQLLIRVLMKTLRDITEPYPQRNPVIRVIPCSYQWRQHIVFKSQPVDGIYTGVLRKEFPVIAIPLEYILLGAEIIDLRLYRRSRRLILILVIPRSADDPDQNPSPSLSMRPELVITTHSIQPDLLRYICQESPAIHYFTGL